jgi:hypothetical protein
MEIVMEGTTIVFFVNGILVIVAVEPVEWVAGFNRSHAVIVALSVWIQQ